MLVKRFFFPLILTWSLLFSAVSSGVSAQTSTTLLVLPAASEVFLNNTKTINLAVIDGVEVNAFDVTLSYDPQVLTLESWAYGGYLSSLARVYLKNDPGEFRVAATQLAKPGVNGDGVLLTLVFKGVGEGTSAIDITAAEFSSPTGVSTLPVMEDGILTVNGPTKTPTSTVTVTTTATATVTRTLTPTNSPTKSPTITATDESRPTATGTLTPTSSATTTARATLTTKATVTPGEAQAETQAAGVFSANTDSGDGVSQAPPEESVPASGEDGENTRLFGIIAVETLDRILAGVLIIFTVILTLLLAVLTRRKSARDH